MRTGGRAVPCGTLGGMRFLNGQRPATDLTYADVFMVPGHSTVGRRLTSEREAM